MCRLWLGLLLAQAGALLAQVARQAVSKVLLPQSSGRPTLQRPKLPLPVSLPACCCLLHALHVACLLEAFLCPFYVVVVLMSSFPCSHPLPLQEPQRAAGSLQIRHTAARKGKGKGPAGQTAPEAQLEKKVVNCLACGKIYDCRSQEPTNDTLLFLGGCIVAAPETSL